MSSLYEQWTPSVGDRVRVVLRDETGPVVATGRTGTVVAVHRDTPEALCDVEYDPREGPNADRERQTHTAAELEPIEGAASRVGSGRRVPGSPAGDPADAWEPTVGDWVAVAATGRRAVITAIDERGTETLCEVEYDHRPGEVAEPQRGTHALRDLVPTREPSADALDDSR